MRARAAAFLAGIALSCAACDRILGIHPLAVTGEAASSADAPLEPDADPMALALTGALTSVGGTVAGAGDYRLLDPGFEAPRACAATGLCITGGLIP
jgi:hypothetical protein